MWNKHSIHLVCISPLFLSLSLSLSTFSLTFSLTFFPSFVLSILIYHYIFYSLSTLLISPFIRLLLLPVDPAVESEAHAAHLSPRKTKPMRRTSSHKVVAVFTTEPSSRHSFFLHASGLFIFLLLFKYLLTIGKEENQAC